VLKVGANYTVTSIPLLTAFLPALTTGPPRGGGATGTFCPVPHSVEGPIVSDVTFIIKMVSQTLI